jgi:hypothetical protein
MTNTNNFFETKADVVRFANEALESLPNGSRWIMTILQVKSGGYYVHTATDTGSDDGVPSNYPYSDVS